MVVADGLDELPEFVNDIVWRGWKVWYGSHEKSTRARRAGITWTEMRDSDSGYDLDLFLLTRVTTLSVSSNSDYDLDLFLPPCRANALSRAPSPPWRPAMRSSKIIPSSSVGLYVIFVHRRLTLCSPWCLWRSRKEKGMLLCPLSYDLDISSSLADFSCSLRSLPSGLSASRRQNRRIC